jgi:hypothetical protein
MKYQSIAVIIAMAFAGSTSVLASDDMTTVWTTDYSGKPPYQRQKETLNTADLARFEIATEEVKSTNFSGKPPFHRNADVLRVVDANRLEIVQEIRFVPAPRRGKN